jgi:threonine/homoserine/homoserine lactone efflux protein
MDLAQFITFSGIYLVAVATPGPGVAAVIARALATGPRRTWPFIFGIVLGDLSWFGLVVAGLSVVAQTYQPIFAAIKYAGAAYLLWMAWKLWNAPAVPPEQQDYVKGDGTRLVLAGLSLTLGNPKTMVFFVAILPQVIRVDHLPLLAGAELAGLMSIILFGVMLVYAVLAGQARRLIRSGDTVRRINRTTGGLMAGVAAAVALR